MAVAASIALGNLRVLELPNGGSVSFAALPILMLALHRGVRSSYLAALAAGLGHALLGGIIVHPVQLVLDYGIAPSALALAGLARMRGRHARAAAIAIAHMLQLLCFSISGVIFFGSQVANTNVWWFSVGYNAATVLPELIISVCAVSWMFAAAPAPNRIVLHRDCPDPVRITTLPHHSRGATNQRIMPVRPAAPFALRLDRRPPPWIAPGSTRGRSAS